MQDIGTVILISSTTEVLSSAETVLDANIVPVSIVILANVVMDNNDVAIESCGLLVSIAVKLMYGNPFIIVINNITIYI